MHTCKKSIKLTIPTIYLNLIFKVVKKNKYKNIHEYFCKCIGDYINTKPEKVFATNHLVITNALTKPKEYDVSRIFISIYKDDLCELGRIAKLFNVTKSYLIRDIIVKDLTKKYPNVLNKINKAEKRIIKVINTNNVKTLSRRYSHNYSEISISFTKKEWDMIKSLASKSNISLYKFIQITAIEYVKPFEFGKKTLNPKKVMTTKKNAKSHVIRCSKEVKEKLNIICANEGIYLTVLMRYILLTNLKQKGLINAVRI